MATLNQARAFGTGVQDAYQPSFTPRGKSSTSADDQMDELVSLMEAMYKRPNTTPAEEVDAVKGKDVDELKSEIQDLKKKCQQWKDKAREYRKFNTTMAKQHHQKIQSAAQDALVAQKRCDRDLNSEKELVQQLESKIEWWKSQSIAQDLLHEETVEKVTELRAECSKVAGSLRTERHCRAELEKNSRYIIAKYDNNHTSCVRLLAEEKALQRPWKEAWERQQQTSIALREHLMKAISGTQHFRKHATDENKLIFVLPIEVEINAEDENLVSSLKDWTRNKDRLEGQVKDCYYSARAARRELSGQIDNGAQEPDDGNDDENGDTYSEGSYQDPEASYDYEEESEDDCTINEQYDSEDDADLEEYMVEYMRTARERKRFSDKRFRARGKQLARARAARSLRR